MDTNKNEPSIVFDQERASSYDEKFAKLAPMKDALHLLMRLVFSELPADSRVLCVGVGTGAELIYLAQAFPQWQFTAVEPATAMLDICRQRADECGIASRCSFHEAYLDSLPASVPFDAATCILVSQFIMHLEDRQRFFRKLTEHLRPGGYLVNADLASDISGSTYNSLFEIWLRGWKYTGIPAEEVENLRASLGRDVAVLPPQEIESIITSSGFETPVLFFQTLLIHAWYAKLAS